MPNLDLLHKSWLDYVRANQEWLKLFTVRLKVGSEYRNVIPSNVAIGALSVLSDELSDMLSILVRLNKDSDAIIKSLKIETDFEILAKKMTQFPSNEQPDSQVSDDEYIKEYIKKKSQLETEESFNSEVDTAGLEEFREAY